MDRNPNVTKFVRCFNLIENHPFFQHDQQQSFTALAIRPDAQLLEVGCGLGMDILRLAHKLGPIGKMIAFDQSEMMLNHCREIIQPRAFPVEFCQGDAHYPQRDFL